MNQAVIHQEPSEVQQLCRATHKDDKSGMEKVNPHRGGGNSLARRGRLGSPAWSGGFRQREQQQEQRCHHGKQEYIHAVMALQPEIVQREGFQRHTDKAHEQTESVAQCGATKILRIIFSYQNSQNKEDWCHKDAVSRVREKPEHSFICSLYRRESFRQSEVAVAEQPDDIESDGADADPARLQHAL